MATEFEPFHVTVDDGIRLYGRRYGVLDPAQPPVVCLSGLSRNSRDFHLFALALAAEGRTVIALDYRGRGQSQRDPHPQNYTVAREMQDVIHILTELGVSKADFVGTSRGGLILHVLAAVKPELIGAAVLNDIGPELAVEGLALIRDYLTKPQQFAAWDDAIDHLMAVHGPDFPALDPADWQDLARAIYRETDGLIIPDFDPALAAPLKDMDLSQPLPDLWAQFDMLKGARLAIIRGENSKLLTQATAEAMRDRHPDVRLIAAAGQGHAPLLHRPDVCAPLLAFLGRQTLPG